MTENRPWVRTTSFLAALLIVGLTAWAGPARSLRLPYAGSLGAKQVDAGEYNVSWEQHSPGVTVTFAKGKDVVATAEGKVLARDVRNTRNSVIYVEKSDGTRAIVEIRFAGMNEVIVFSE